MQSSVIVVTDGRASDPSALKTEVDALHKLNIEVFAIGVSQTAAEADLKLIASRPTNWRKYDSLKQMDEDSVAVGYQICDTKTGQSKVPNCPKTTTPLTTVNSSSNSSIQSSTQSTTLVVSRASSTITRSTTLNAPTNTASKSTLPNKITSLLTTTPKLPVVSTQTASQPTLPINMTSLLKTTPKQPNVSTKTVSKAMLPKKHHIPSENNTYTTSRFN